MTSAINTNGINVNYPVPGVNNNSQGFRDNFAAIRTNLNTSATEITDLQNKVVVKQALDGTVVNNDMANTVISNAVTRSFRASTYNLGNALSGTVVINASLGDVQYGTIASNTTIQFGGWAPAGTQSNLELALSFSNSSAYVTFPAQVVNTDNFGALTIENGANIGNVLNVTVPYGVTLLNYRLSTLDCGNTITIEPINRPREATQIDKRTPPSTGYLGDVVGTFCIDPAQTAQPTNCTATEATYDKITCVSTTGFYLDMPIVFTGTSFDANITTGTTYYVRTIPSSTTFTVSAAPGTVSGPGTILALVGGTGNMTANPIQYMYASTGNYDATTLTKTAANTIAVTDAQSVLSTSSTGNVLIVTSTANYAVGDQVSFTGTNAVSYATATYATGNVITVNDATLYTVGMPVQFGGVIIGGANLANATTYYVTNIYTGNSNITVSTTYGGGNVALTDASGNMSVTYGGRYSGLSTSAYYVQSIANGTAFTVSATQGGAQVALTSATGPASGAQAMTATVVTDSVITLNNTTSLEANDPIVFTGNVFGGVTSGQPYYITNVSGSNVSISQTRYNGIAGQKFQVSTANGSMAATSLQGTDIWKRLPLNPW